MAKTLQYWGTGNFQEHPYTGRIVTWTEKEKQTVDDAIATKLLASGAGFVLDNDETGEVVTSRIDPVTGRVKKAEVAGRDMMADLGVRTNQSLSNLRTVSASGNSFSTLAAATFSGSGGSGAFDSVASTYGNIPAVLTVDAGNTANYAQLVDTTIPGAFLDDGGPLVVVAEIVSGMNTNNTIKLIFSSDGATSKTMTATLTINKDRGPLQFWRIYPDTNDFIGAGSETFANTMNYMAIKADSAGGTTGGVVKIHGVWKAQRQRPFVILQFDDGWLSQYTSAFQYMMSRGLVGDIGVGYGYAGANYCSDAQLNEMYQAGWDMVVHGVKNHTDASLTTAALLKAEIKANQDNVLGKGWTRGAYDYIYPGGIINSTLDSKEQLRSLGIRSARLVTSGQVHQTRWGVDDPLALNGRELSGSYSAASDLALLDRAINNNSGLIFYGHKIVRASPAANEMTFAEFKTLIDGIHDRVRDGKVDCIKQAQFADRYL